MDYEVPLWLYTKGTGQIHCPHGFSFAWCINMSRTLDTRSLPLRFASIPGVKTTLSAIATTGFFIVSGVVNASFPAVINVVNDSEELRNDARITVDGEWTPSRAMGDLDGDGLGDRIIEINETSADPCPGVAIWLSTQTNTFSFTRAELDGLVRITDRLETDDPGETDCLYRNLRVFTEPRRIGDVNGDGLIDLSVNVSGIFDNITRIILGTTTGGTRIDLDALNGSNGFELTGIAQILSPMGDVNGDGYDDFSHSSGLSNIAGVVAGRPAFTSPLIIEETPSPQHLIGPAPMQGLRGLGDIDGDGNADVLAFRAEPENTIENRIPRFIYGASDLSVTSLDDTTARIDRNLPECGPRQCLIVPVGDLDADGRDDILASQRFQTDNIPPRSILYGRAGGLVIRNEINDFPEGERTQLVRGNTGTISDRGEFFSGSFNDPFRTATGQRFDLDGDGVEDLLLEERITPERQGFYALFGIAGSRPPVRSIDEADGLLGVAFDLGDALSPVSSVGAPALGDLNLDGIDDFRWTSRRDIPYVPGRSRDLNGFDVLGLGIRRSPTQLSLFWQPISGTASYRIEINNLLIAEVPADQTEFVTSDPSGGAALQATVNAIDANGVVLSTQIRQLPLFSPLINSFSAVVYGQDLLELFIESSRDDFDRPIIQRLAVERNGDIVGQSPGRSFLDDTVTPGGTFDYRLLSNVLFGTNFQNTSLNEGPRIQLASGIVTANTPADPNASTPVAPNTDTPNEESNPTSPANLRAERYSAFDIEVFWDRADEEELQYEVFRDGKLVRTQFGISFYDSRRPENSGSTYEIVALRRDRSRSDACTIIVSAVEGDVGGDDGVSGDDVSNPDAPEAPDNLRVVRYSFKDAELFWDRAADPLLQYEVRRDGVVLRSPFFGTSFFDTTLVDNAGATYEVIAIASDGSRSTTSSVVLAGENTSGALPGETPLSGAIPSPEALRVDVYSSTAAELFWTRAPSDAQIVSTEVTRDGVIVGNSPGNSFFDNTRMPGIQHTYMLVAIDASGNRSEVASITVAP